MSLRKRWMTLPWDARLGFAAPSCFALWLALVVAAGPNLILLMSGCLAYPLLAAVALIVAFRLAVGPHRRQRVLPLALVSGCLAATVASPPGMTTDLHLVARIYAAGGPGTVNAWGQGLIRDQQGEGQCRMIEPQELPPGIRNHLRGWISVGGTLWSELPRVRVEFGGGFYHYGVVVYPTGSVPPAEWWQQLLGWPPEVVVYHED